VSDDRITLQLWNAQQGYQEVLKAWEWMKAMLVAGHRLVLTVRRETRSIAQNNLMWSCLTDLSKQVKWFGKYMTPEGWKDFITGHINGQELVPNMDGTGFVSLTKGRSTSDMTIKEMTVVIELCHAFGADQGVKWSKTSLGRGEIDPDTGEIRGMQ
jgi:hypothetical protein